MKAEFKPKFSVRANQIPESFIREILAVTAGKDVISFAGGLPNPRLFPSQEMAEAAEKVLLKDGSATLQYSISEGFLPLRQWIAKRYSRQAACPVTADQVIILNGSQQGLDLLGKIFINPGDKVLMEAPSYLGAIQAFSAYQPEFSTVPLHPDGIGMDILEDKLFAEEAAFLYAIPDFQNPSGYSYSMKKRMALAEKLRKYKTLLIEDGAYREICFNKGPMPSIHSMLPEQTVHLGSFSKTVSPGMRMGYAIGPREIIRKMVLAKQAGDLHSNFFAQKVLYQYLQDNSFEEHLLKLRSFYSSQAKQMSLLLKEFLPELHFSPPEGGMFIWLTFPEGMASEAILQECMKENVVFVPGCKFYLNKEGQNSARFNFSNPDETQMRKGLATVKSALEKLKYKADLPELIKITR